ncbi:MAG: hypothetical protein CM15mP25_0390 [Gammaproteobacteria bacterium]|nr:MAG: hypothetical protein CM15mP25_0390 [Gammaproteobacteria bacterium]
MLNQNNKTRLHRLETGRPKTRKTLIILGLFLSVVMISISGCSPRDGNSFLAQTRCAQLGDTTLASGSELLIVVNHIRARLGLPDFVGSWEFALDALYLGMCLDLMTSDAIAFIDRYERALVSSIDKNISNIRSLSVAIDPTVAPENAPSDAFEMLMNRDEPMDLRIILSMVVGAAFARHTVCVTLYATRMEKAHEHKRLLAIMKDRAFTPSEHGETGEHTFMNLGRPVGCLWEHATRAPYSAFAILFLLWSDNASAESDVIFLCCVVYPLLALGYATLEFVSSSNRFITNHRVVQSTTFFFPREDLYADSVSGLEVRRSVVGTLFGYGTLEISAEGQTFNMPYVKDANEVKLTWDKLAHQMQA